VNGVEEDVEESGYFSEIIDFGKILDKIKKSEVNEKKTQTPRSPNPLMQRLRKHSPEVETPKNNPNIPGNSISQRKK
jgi:hypothetical protein